MEPDDLTNLRAELSATKAALDEVRRELDLLISDGRIEVIRVRKWREQTERYKPLREAFATGGPEHALATLLDYPQHQQPAMLAAFTDDELISVVSKADKHTRARIVEAANLSPTRRTQIEFASSPALAKGVYRVSNATKNVWTAPDRQISAKLAKDIDKTMPGLAATVGGKSYVRGLTIGSVPRFFYGEQLAIVREHVEGFHAAELAGVLTVEELSISDATNLVISGNLAPRTTSPKATKAIDEQIERERAEEDRWRMISERMVEDRASLVRGDHRKADRKAD